MLENLIAQTLTDFLVLFVAKLISVLAIFTLTKSVKTTFKKTIKPFIRNLTYKEGYDKTMKIKNFFSKIGNAIKSAVKYVCISNPRTSLATLITGCLSATFGFVVDTADVLAIFNFPDITICGIEIIPYTIAILAFVLINIFGINYGRETNSEADERKATEKAEKEEKELKRQEQERIAQEEKAKVEFEKNAEKLANEMIATAEKEAREKELNDKLKARAEQIIAERKKTEN